MEIWIDAQLSPAIALWINQSFEGVNACSIRSLGLKDADDESIFLQAKTKKAVIMTKDADFAILLDRFGSPPQIVWITAGNTSNARIREILQTYFPTITEMLSDGEPLIEISGDYI